MHMELTIILYGAKKKVGGEREWMQIQESENIGGNRGLRNCTPTRRSNQSILKEISPKYSLEGLMLKLKLQYFGHLMGRTDLFEKTLMLGKTEGGRRME